MKRMGHIYPWIYMDKVYMDKVCVILQAIAIVLKVDRRECSLRSGYTGLRHGGGGGQCFGHGYTRQMRFSIDAAAVVSLSIIL